MGNCLTWSAWTNPAGIRFSHRWSSQLHDRSLLLRKCSALQLCSLQAENTSFRCFKFLLLAHGFNSSLANAFVYASVPSNDNVDYTCSVLMLHQLTHSLIWIYFLINKLLYSERRKKVKIFEIFFFYPPILFFQLWQDLLCQCRMSFVYASVFLGSFLIQCGNKHESTRTENPYSWQ